MDPQLKALFSANSGVLAAAVIKSLITVGELRRLVRLHQVFPVTHGVYSDRPVSPQIRLKAAETIYGQPVTACLGTAADLWGFDTEDTVDAHIHDPEHRHLKTRSGIVIHQRLDAPVTSLDGQLLTTPAWTAVEVARSLARPRALATLDAALRTELCTVEDLQKSADDQAGRRGIVHTRELVPLADGRAASPMESESRLLMIDAGLPRPELNYPVLDSWGHEKYYLDFAWLDVKVGAEYDSTDFHSGGPAMRRDKARVAWLQEHGWLIIPITSDDVRRWPRQLVRRIGNHLAERAAAA
jgi:hypothetical protein